MRRCLYELTVVALDAAGSRNIPVLLAGDQARKRCIIEGFYWEPAE
jgi:hypothetical protein